MLPLNSQCTFHRRSWTLSIHPRSLMDTVRSDGRNEWIIQQVVASKIHSRPLTNIYIANDLKRIKVSSLFYSVQCGIQKQATIRKIKQDIFYFLSVFTSFSGRSVKHQLRSLRSKRKEKQRQRAQLVSNAGNIGKLKVLESKNWSLKKKKHSSALQGWARRRSLHLFRPFNG